MTDQEALDFTHKVFESIENSKTIFDLENIPNQIEALKNCRMNIDGYAKIEFDIQPNEIQTLIDNGVLDKEFNFARDITSKLTDPFAKILYAIAWKNGDLKKIRHILKGIIDSKNNDSDQDDSLVFYQFGKYLTKKPGQPIIDQHVIRAYAIYCSTDNAKVKTLRKLEALDKTHKPIINGYKVWLISDNLRQELRNEKDYTYYIDKLLFTTGKTIKSRKPRKEKNLKNHNENE